MMMKHITCATAAALLLSAPAAFAQAPVTPQPNSDRPKAAMGQRLRDGARTGQLTRGELAQIRSRLTAFRAHAKAQRATGQLSREARASLRQEWRRVSRLVFTLRHNRVHRTNR